MGDHTGGILQCGEQVAHDPQRRFLPASAGDLADFEVLANVSNLTVDGAVLRCRVAGSPDALVKQAARHAVVDLLSEEPDLEELFLAYHEERDMLLHNVFTKSLWDQRHSLLAWALGVAAVAAMYASFYPSLPGALWPISWRVSPEPQGRLSP